MKRALVSSIAAALCACSLVTPLSDLEPVSGVDSGAPTDAACGDLQKDPKNCGVCGRDCLGGTCTAGACDPAPLAAAQVAPSSIAVDSTHVYWIVGGAIRRTTLSVGGAVENVGSGTISGLGLLRVDGTNLFAVAWNVSTSAYSIPSSEVSGTVAPSVIATFAGGAPTGFGLDAQHLFVFQQSNLTGCGIPPCLIASARDGKNPVKLWAGNATSDRVAIDGGRAFLLSGASLSSIGPLDSAATALATLDATGGEVAADATSAYATLPSLGSIVAVPRAGGKATTVAIGQASPRLLTASTGWIAWLTDVGLMGCDPLACTKPTFYGPSSASSIAIDAQAVYWTEPKRAGIFLIRR